MREYSKMWDVAIVGGGPAGASCAAFCATAGLRTLLLEREKFPREKVCGDCLNPSCWPVLRRLQVADRIHAAPHGKLRCVDFISVNGTFVRVPLPLGENAEIAIKRSVFDDILLDRARQLGAVVREKFTLSAVTESDKNWEIAGNEEMFEARVLVAADGRNSTVARLCGLLPRLSRERVALQAHVRLPRDFGERVVLQFLRGGYSGQAPIGESELNLCLVGRASSIPALRQWAEANFEMASNHPWRTVTPLTRGALAPARRRLLLIGDTARVVEPFTGEGIYYALASGELASAAIAKFIHGEKEDEIVANFVAAHAELYRGRLWVNRLARAAVLSPRFASFALRGLRHQPSWLQWLTGKIVA